MTPQLYGANFLVFIYHGITTMTLVIRHFLGPVCRNIEVINVLMWWDPRWDLRWEQGVHDEFINGLT